MFYSEKYKEEMTRLYGSLPEKGSVVPHGIYDLQQNDAMINIGVSVETSEFACNSIKLWWEALGCHRYRDATALFILVDCGGSNANNRHIF